MLELDRARAEIAGSATQGVGGLVTAQRAAVGR